MSQVDEILGIRDSLVYIAEDDFPSRKMLRAVLSKNGLNVELFNTGEELLSRTRQKQPDLFLLDVMMPEVDGFETCKRLKQNPESINIPVIFLSANTTCETKEEGFEVGGVDFIEKPFRQRDLMFRILTHIRLKKALDKVLEYNHWLEKQINDVVSR